MKFAFAVLARLLLNNVIDILLSPKGLCVQKGVPKFLEFSKNKQSSQCTSVVLGVVPSIVIYLFIIIS